MEPEGFVETYKTLAKSVFAEPPSGILSVIGQDRVRPGSLEARHGLQFRDGRNEGTDGERTKSEQRIMTTRFEV